MRKLIKKRNIICVNLTERAMIVMQRHGLIDGNKKSKNGEVSSFVSHLICDYSIKSHKDKREINIELAKIKLLELQRERDIIEETMLRKANYIEDEKKLL